MKIRAMTGRQLEAPFGGKSSAVGQQGASMKIRPRAMLWPLLRATKSRRAMRTECEQESCHRKLPLAPRKTTSKNVINFNACILMKTTTVVLLPLLLLLQSDTRFHLRPTSPQWWWNSAEAVSVERLQVPDLVVIDQHQFRVAPTQGLFVDQANNSSRPAGAGSPWPPTGLQSPRDQAGPQAASLINSAPEAANQQQQITFECLVSYDLKKDKNLIVKWHHDKRTEPIYQWIPELGKRSIAPLYRPFIAPITDQPQQHLLQSEPGGGGGGGIVASHSNSTPSAAPSSGNQIQLLEAGFRLIRPTKELGGRYTCSAISSQNDDSKTKKMIVYTPPKSFTFNASRADIGALLTSQRDRLALQMQPVPNPLPPAAYRSRDLTAPTTMSPQMYSTIDYVNVSQQRARQQPSPLQQYQQQQQQQQYQPQQAPARYMSHFNRTSHGAAVAVAAAAARQQLGVKLVCDIDQVFPVLEVSIYRLARPDGSHPEKLAKLDTRIERDAQSGLFHVQVTSILDDDDLALIQRQQQRQQQESNDEIYFECLIALTNLELSKYADNKRSIIYRPGQQRDPHHQDLATLEQLGSSSSSGRGLTLTPSSSAAPPSVTAGQSVKLAPLQFVSVFIGLASVLLHRGAAL